MTPNDRHPYTVTLMEKIAALAVLTAVAVVVALVLGIILVLFLSSADYVRAGEDGLPDEPVCTEAGLIIECSDLPGIAPQPDSDPTYPTQGPAPDPDPIADYGSTPGLTLPDTAMAGR